MYDPKQKRDPDQTDEQAFEDPPDTQPSPSDDGSVIVLDDDGEYD